GKDLQKMGYPPGPAYKDILAQLWRATLDGEITDRHVAEAFVRKTFDSPTPEQAKPNLGRKRQRW
ncbi:MAG: hypothetical protein GDA44_11525, partial [Prochloron sp. SP5CPC1]|nr:hypothetical protein [Candidatus Paraprochloron terpiosi SP5CPC1]